MVSKYLGAQPILKGIILLVILVLIFSLFFRVFSKRNEGFGNFYNVMSPYVDAQKDYYWNNFNRGLVHTDGLANEISRLDDATKSVDTQYNIIRNPNIQRFFSGDPLPGVAKTNEVCVAASEPSQLLRHYPGALEGCGWWYIDDNNQESVSSTGTQDGPYDSNIAKTHPGGIWIWDLDEAQKLEDIKRCRRLKSCDLLSVYPGKCGFCPSTGASLPVDKYGNSKYSDDPRYICPDSLITNSDACPAPVGSAGTVNPDGTLNQIPTPPGLCDPTGGRLSKECLIALAKGVGLSDTGAIVSILSGDGEGYLKGKGESSFKYTTAIQSLNNECSIVSKPAFVGVGSCSKESAIEYYVRIYDTAKKAADLRCRAVAGFLAFGTNYDPCDYDSNEKGPFQLYCLQRAFREAGCQPAGSSYPVASNKTNMDALTWGGVKEVYAALRENSNSNDPGTQMDNARKCLGVEIKPNLSDCGNERGCDIFWYEWEYDWKFPDNKTTSQLFMGREVAATLPYLNTGDGSFNPFNRRNTICFRARTAIVNPGTSARAVRMWIMTDDGIAVKTEGTTILRKWFNQAPAAYTTSPFAIAGLKSTPVEIYWFQNYGGSTFMPKISTADGNFTTIPAETLKLVVPSGFPVCRWDFYMGDFEDRNNVLQSARNNLTLGAIAGKKCALFSDRNSALIIKNRVRAGAFRTFTFMINVKNIPNMDSRIFSFRKGPISCNGDATFRETDAVEGGIHYDGGLWLGVKAANGRYILRLDAPANTIIMNQWVHIVYSFDNDCKGASIYANGARVASVRKEDIDGSFHDQLICDTVAIGLGLSKVECNVQPIECGLAWSHWFDYAFTLDNVKQDMKMIFTKSSVYPEDITSGWITKN
jgi:hypothetical protein